VIGLGPVSYFIIRVAVEAIAETNELLPRLTHLPKGGSAFKRRVLRGFALQCSFWGPKLPIRKADNPGKLKSFRKKG